MVGGFNTNVSYRGRTFHVQTEDSGRRSPKIVTLLYEGGTILLSRKSSYEDRLEDPDLESVVRELMEEQHRAMVGALRIGQLDGAIGVEAQGDEADTPTSPRTRAAAVELEFGESQISERTLDVVVLEHLRD